MNDLIQYVIVGAVILAAMIYLVKRLRGKIGAQGACGCDCADCPGAAHQAPASSRTPPHPRKGK